MRTTRESQNGTHILVLERVFDGDVAVDGDGEHDVHAAEPAQHAELPHLLTEGRQREVGRLSAMPSVTFHRNHRDRDLASATVLAAPAAAISRRLANSQHGHGRRPQREQQQAATVAQYDRQVELCQGVVQLFRRYREEAEGQVYEEGYCRQYENGSARY